ncbi:MAG: hypothetical protein CL583_01890 [Alteromonadaceae bacterium]|nr:hypothetical protein [Alteromonadaceae bacterium]|tara:strand:- start:715 stop:978 length:264 start_codon:yes stop_codon:yes gene_type:complete
MNGLDRTRIALGGHGAIAKVARGCDVSQQAARKWFAEGVLPSTEVTYRAGKRLTEYGKVIEALTEGAVTDAELQDENLALLEKKPAA